MTQVLGETLSCALEGCHVSHLYSGPAPSLVLQLWEVSKTCKSHQDVALRPLLIWEVQLNSASLAGGT